MIRLHANENPWGPSPSVAAGLVRASTSEYPDAGGLEGALADTLGIPSDRIVLGNGSTELIGLLIQTLCAPHQAVATCEAGFVAYRQLARAAGRRLQLSRPRPGGGTDLDALADVVDATTALVFVANPDNPSGTLCSAAALDRFLAALPSPGPLVVLDEAYREYVHHADYPTPTRYLGDPRVVVLRTFSKAHGLAGLRCGYLAASPTVAARVQAVGGPYRVGCPTRAAALAALADREHVQQVVSRTTTERERLHRALTGLGLRVVDSHASFLMVHLGLPAEPVAHRLAESGVFVRALGPYGWHDALRLTVGRPTDNDRALRAFEPLLEPT
ncbi:MAG: histidinol-phosphate transaminase [Myxococcota bacterium]